MNQLNPIWIAVIYAGASFATFVTAIGIDSFLIFSNVYISFAIVGPPFLLSGLMIYWRIRFHQRQWLVVVLGCAMVFGVSFLHVLLVATASATV